MDRTKIINKVIKEILSEAPGDDLPKVDKSGKSKVGDVKISNGIKSTITNIDKETGAIKWDIAYLPNFDKLFDDVTDLVGTAKGVYTKAKGDDVLRVIYDEARVLRNKIRTHIRNEYPEEYRRITMNEGELEEMSTTGGGAGSATFTPGTGMQYATPYAFKRVKKKKEEVKENLKDYIKISEPSFRKDKNNPNFLSGYIKYDTGGGSSMALGKETMSGQIRRLSSAEAVRQMDNIAKKLNDSFDIEDIEVTDLENGVVELFAVSDDFIDMDPRSELSMALLEENENFEMGDRVKLTPDYEETPGEVFTITQTSGNRYFIADEDGRGWYTYGDQLVIADYELDEGIGASLGPGPKASADGVKDNSYVKEFGYKLVPKKIKGSGLEVKQLFEAEGAGEFQEKRIQAFDRIEQELNDIYKMLSNAKNETNEYYNDNPSSYSVLKPTDLVLDYIKDIKDLLKGE